MKKEKTTKGKVTTLSKFQERIVENMKELAAILGKLSKNPDKAIKEMAQSLDIFNVVLKDARRITPDNKKSEKMKAEFIDGLKEAKSRVRVSLETAMFMQANKKTKKAPVKKNKAAVAKKKK